MRFFKHSFANASEHGWLPWMRRCVVAVLAAASVTASAQIQIIPLPDQKPAIVKPLGAHDLTANDVQAWLDQAMNQGMAHAPVAGAVVVVVKDNGILLSKGYGYADVAAKKPVDPASTLFRAGSTSKLFTWTAVMQLVQQGKLDLDADINRYLDIRIPPRDGKPVTLRELMTHTAGFEDVIKDLYVPDAASLTSNEAWLKRWVPERIYPAGEVPAYSNYGAALAGYIVQRVSGQSFDAYVEANIFQRLGMQHATFRQPLPASLQKDMAPGYRAASEPPQPFELIPAAPAGALSISGDDMGRFMVAHLQGGGEGDTQLTTAPVMQAMHGYKRVNVPGLQAMGLGFVHMDRNGQDVIGHSGDTQYFHNRVALFPQQHVGVFIALDGARDDALLRGVIDGFTDRYFPALPQAPQPTLATARAHGAQLLGRYLPSRQSASTFRALRNLFVQTEVSMADDGTLRVSGIGTPDKPARWREVKPYVWLDDATGTHLGAVMQDGHVRWLATDDMAPTQVLLPMTGAQSTLRHVRILSASLAVLLLAALVWPLVALVQRVRRQPALLGDAALRWYRLSRVTAVLLVLFATGWCLMMPRLVMGTSALDGRLHLLQLIGWLAVAGTIAVVMNGWHAWREPGRWWRKLDSVVLLLACGVSLWFAWTQHLLSLHLNY